MFLHLAYTVPHLHIPPSHRPPSHRPTVPPSTIPPSHRPTIPPSHRPTIPPFHRPTIPPSHHSTIPPSHRPTVPPSHRPTIPAEIAPPGAYHRLKLAMLLSLVSASQNTDSRSSLLDLLAVGSDIPLLLQLLTYGSSFAQRSVLHSSAGDLCGSARKETSGCFMDGRHQTLWLYCV